MNSAIHELRNHLCVAMAGLSALLDRKLDCTDARLTAIYCALTEVDALIEDLPRDPVVVREIRTVPLDVCAVIAGQMAALEGLATERGIALHVDDCLLAHPHADRFLGDPVRIAEIVTNVVINAISYSPSRGSVRVWYRRDVAGLRFRVSDDGPGVSSADRLRVFESGFRGPGAGNVPGSGIGLALVKQFVDYHGGSIEISAGFERGTILSIALPGTPPAPVCGRCRRADEAERLRVRREPGLARPHVARPGRPLATGHG